MLRLHKHQEEAIRVARGGHSYVLTTGTGSGKSLAYIVPIVDYVLRHGPGHGIRAIVVYPMNALANSQMKELEKFLLLGYPNKRGPVTFARYTGQESEEEREHIRANPPDILLTNYLMLELILTRSTERRLVVSQTLQFLVLDELHTYLGRQGADVALLVRERSDGHRPTAMRGDVGDPGRCWYVWRTAGRRRKHGFPDIWDAGQARARHWRDAGPFVVFERRNS